MALDFEGIRREVSDAGGIKYFKMQVLRDASPYRKLGPNVNEEISTALHQKGLDHTTLPSYQDQTVYVYEQGSKAASLMVALTGTPSEDGARAILKAVKPDANGNAEKRLAEVKALLVQMQDVFSEPIET